MKHELAVKLLQERLFEETKRAKAQEAEIEWCQSNIAYDSTHDVSKLDIPKFEERMKKAKERLEGHHEVIRELDDSVALLKVSRK